MKIQTLTGGFSDPSTDGARAFRVIMNAVARPGRIGHLTGATPPSPMSIAAGTLLLTLCDPDTPIAVVGTLDTDAIRGWITFHTGAPIVDPDAADYVFGKWAEVKDLKNLKKGEAQYPDRSATVVVELDSLVNQGAILTGPGIHTSLELSLPELELFQQNSASFPLGLDFIFCCNTQIAGLPRSTKIQEAL
ncbi:MAG: phosphonate C-P lyase system protein PhnH [Rhodobacteraceae bacterium]|jgi:alpha-D-ribose 1-methylphosphonate 5-triphosphate synthase subunit PhnH|nr:phosphonate C-P lyase system protein PhnH [Paracoccaceae bacterium]